MPLSTATLTTLKQLYNFKGNFGSAVRTILNNAGFTQVYLEKSNTALGTPSRIEVSFDLGEAMNQQSIQGAEYGGVDVWDAWEGCSLKLRICTLRPDDAGSPIPGIASLHDEFCAAMYVAFEERQAPFANPLSILPLYEVSKIRPRPSLTSFDPHFMEDFTLIEFEICFGIRPEAFPP